MIAMIDTIYLHRFTSWMKLDGYLGDYTAYSAENMTGKTLLLRFSSGLKTEMETSQKSASRPSIYIGNPLLLELLLVVWCLAYCHSRQPML
jgi:hypothetical protein